MYVLYNSNYVIGNIRLFNPSHAIRRFVNYIADFRLSRIENMQLKVSSFAFLTIWMETRERVFLHCMIAMCDHFTIWSKSIPGSKSIPYDYTLHTPFVVYTIRSYP